MIAFPHFYEPFRTNLESTVWFLFVCDPLKKLNIGIHLAKQWIEGNLVNFISEAKLGSKQDAVCCHYCDTRK